MPHSLQDYQIYPTPIVKDISILIPGDVFELDINRTGRKHRLVFERNGRNRIKKCTDIDDNQGWNIRHIGKVNVIGKREKLTKPAVVESLKSGESCPLVEKKPPGREARGSLVSFCPVVGLSLVPCSQTSPER
jgi:hypothetical protein